MQLPPELMERLVMWCRENEIGMAQIGNNEAGVMMIVMGRKEHSPNTVSIVAAHMLLTGVLSGEFAADNAERAASDDDLLDKTKVN